MKVLLDLVREYYPVIYKAWDHHSYVVNSPISLDGLGHIEVVLSCKNGRDDVIMFDLVPRDKDQAPTVTR